MSKRCRPQPEKEPDVEQGPSDPLEQASEDSAVSVDWTGAQEHTRGAEEAPTVVQPVIAVPVPMSTEPERQGPPLK
eukprot:CAMPEP_0114359720 /NCGR_PEP_ID=MMETSP0101-20121206/23233_1 /TAXON_ID=38822 ORGANISM="Pteridomonas danica, Strain PT" /NCGR_SAMPLE_ID=MMETSP0101 /ASSEMBLY_ACC=CAM_ASM_000211 /LENGTH=75 /DNA_ID=CAMNT_0001503413 /DNA_START=435 /DNA_END=662 /DNA_ORIENTATION=-